MLCRLANFQPTWRRGATLFSNRAVQNHLNSNSARNKSPGFFAQLFAHGPPRSFSSASSTVWTTLRSAAELTDSDDDHLGILSRHQVLGWTYTELYKRVLSVAVGLRSLGIERQDRIMVCVGGNDSEKLLTHFGAPLAGIDVVSITDPAMLAAAQQEMNCKALVISPQNFVFFDDIADLPQTFEHPPILTGPVQVPPNDTGRPPLVHSFIELVTELATAPVDELEEIAHFVLHSPFNDTNDDDEANNDEGAGPRIHFADEHAPILVLRSMKEADLVEAGKGLAKLVTASTDDRILVASELATAFGTASALGAVSSGATIVLTNLDAKPPTPGAPATDEVTVLSTLHDSKCTILFSDQERFHNIPLPIPKVHDITHLRGGVVNADIDNGLSCVYAGIPMHTTHMQFDDDSTN